MDVYTTHLFIVLLPLIAAIVAGLFGSLIGRNAAHWVTILAVGTSFLMSFILLINSIYGEFYTENYTLYTWGISGDLRMEIGFLVDRLTLLMMVVVTFVSLMVHIYTIGYMHDDPGYQRFFSFISLFTFAMLMLVMSNNFLQLFFGWEAVGLFIFIDWFLVQT
jgi:NADH-quinone oxidoreductase subunit L